jgi:outer membrane protein OmpA-like peptidoglycan-associated protein
MKVAKLLLVLAMVSFISFTLGCNKWHGVTGGGKLVDAVLIQEPEVEVVKADPTTVRIKDKVLFDFDSFKLDARAQGIVQVVASLMEKYPDTVLALEGHTDKYGPDDYNINLSIKRAQAVADSLIAEGVAQERISKITGFGKQQLIPNLTNRENRRVIILSIGE